MNKIKHFFGRFIGKFRMVTFDDWMHFIVSYFVALSMRGDVVENAWAIVPTIVIILLLECYVHSKTEDDRFKITDLKYDFMGGLFGYIFALVV